jgi:phage host-nuclease inhibitor protein Gam
MARKRLPDEPTLKTWQDADDTLRQIAEAKIALDDIEGSMNTQIIGIKKIAEQEAQPYTNLIKRLENDLKVFAADHRDDFGNAKTKALTFGEVGYRSSTKIVLPKAKEKLEEIIRKLKARKMNDCIVTTETVNKENLKKYGADVVVAVGAKMPQEDTFGYDVYLDKLKRLTASGE